MEAAYGRTDSFIGGMDTTESIMDDWTLQQISHI